MRRADRAAARDEGVPAAGERRRSQGADRRSTQRGARSGDFEAGIRTALQAVLASPQFMFRLERSARRREARAELPDHRYRSGVAAVVLPVGHGAGPGARRRRDEGRRCGRPACSTRRSRRMLTDPRSATLSTRFASQWLRLQDLDKIHPDALTYPGVRPLRSPSRCSARPSCSSTRSIREDRSVLELLTADWTFVNERLARHYGIPNVIGDRVPARAARRREPPRAARPRQHPDDDVGGGSHVAGAARQVGAWKCCWHRRRRRRRPTCRPSRKRGRRRRAAAVGARAHGAAPRRTRSAHSCHRVIDPLGLALENFDVTGAWRIKDNGVADRSVGDALRRLADQRAGWPAPGAAQAVGRRAHAASPRT